MRGEYEVCSLVKIAPTGGGITAEKVICFLSKQHLIVDRSKPNLHHF